MIHEQRRCTQAIRDARQQAILEWMIAAFGKETLDIHERIMRFLEEAFELAQAEGLPIERAIDVARHVYSRPAGCPTQEVGGIAAEDCEYDEVCRVLSIPIEIFRKRHNAKADAGIALRATTELSESNGAKSNG